jgi:hypothetical protein
MSTFPSTYFFFFFFCSAYILAEMGFHYLGIELNALYDRRLERLALEEKINAMKDDTTIRRKVTFYKPTGYAFSQQSGQDKLVTGNLTERMENALLK